MPKWPKDATEFTVRVNDSNGKKTNIPKPVWNHLDDPDEVTFKILKNGTVTVEKNK